jgi:type VI secretion system protein VasD
MNCYHPSFRRGLIVVGLLVAGCAKAPPGPPAITIAAPAGRGKAAMSLAATGDANPDGTGRPSPVVVRVYQLRTDTAFAGADFFPLFDDDQKVLGPEMITRDEFVLAPAEKRTLDVTISGETRFVGAIAAFRDVRNAQWRVVVPVPRRGLNLTVERARIVLTAAN